MNFLTYLMNSDLKELMLELKEKGVLSKQLIHKCKAFDIENGLGSVKTWYYAIPKELRGYFLQHLNIYIGLASRVQHTNPERRARKAASKKKTDKNVL